MTVLFNRLALNKPSSVTPVLQNELAECGLACLTMLLNAHGKETHLATLRARYAFSSYGMDLSEIMDIAAHEGLITRALQLELDEVDQLSLPCILHWDMTHFVVLTRVSRNSVTICDPDKGVVTLSFSQLNQHFTGIALEAEPCSALTKETKTVSFKLRDLIQGYRGISKNLSVIGLLSLLLQLLLMTTPVFTQIMLDNLSLSIDDDLLVIFCGIFTLVLLLRIAINYLRDQVVINFTSKLNTLFAAKLIHHLLSLPITYFHNRHIGDIISRFTSIEKVKEAFGHTMVASLVDVSLLIMSFIMMSMYNLTVSLLVLGIFLLYLGYRFMTYGSYKEATNALIGACASQESNFIETIRGISTVKAMGFQRERTDAWLNQYISYINQDIRLTQAEVRFRLARQLATGISTIMVIALSALALNDGDITIGMFVAYLSYLTLFTQHAESVIETIVELKMIRLHLERLADIFVVDAEPSVPLSPAIHHQLTFQSLSVQGLAYQPDPRAQRLFNNVTFDVKRGESLVIVGASGQGKTSLLRCILGLLPTAHGQILVDHKEVCLRQLKGDVACVMQDDQLFSGTVADNICSFESARNHHAMVEAAQSANIDQDIEALPLGYDTLVGDMGSLLSGGQKQRLLLARALYRQPKILILDEATSHLDNASEQIINASIAKLNIIKIIVAHRQETIASADKVYQL